MRFGSTFSKCALAFGLLTFAVSVQADQPELPDCANAPRENGPNFASGPDCTFSWVENNRLQTVIWTQVADDFEPAVLDRNEAGVPVLQSSWLPELIDVDQDGWLDLVSFTRVGMVNGTFDVFLYNPETATFDQSATLYGHTLLRDLDGFIVSLGRNGPGAIYQFHSADRQLAFQFEIDPYARRGKDMGCDIAVGEGGDPWPAEEIDLTALSFDPAILVHYCNPGDDPDQPGRAVSLGEEAAQIEDVSANTLFHCRFQGGTHTVTITQNADGLRYAYGPLNGTPELVMERTYDEIAIFSDNGAGPSRFGEIAFTNGAYEYVAFYAYELFDADGVMIQSGDNPLYPNDTFMRGLVVYKDNDVANPVFRRNCDLDQSFDNILGFDRP